MSIITDKKEEMGDIETAKLVTSALRDISANRIEELRNKFETNLRFYNEIGELYSLVKEEAYRRMEVAGSSKENLFPDESRRKGLVSVAVTSNSHFYGALNRDIMDEFMKHYEKGSRTDLLIIGKTGVQYIENKKLDMEYKEMHFESESPTAIELKKFLSEVDGYRNVYMFYPKFINVFEQRVGTRDISFMPKKMDIKKSGEATKYVSEPMFPKMFEFFETQVKYILVRRTMLESDLSRTAARLMKMDQAEGKAIEKISKSKRELESAINRMQNIRLLETFSGFAKWK